MLEHRIAQLEERLLSARVITKKEISKDTVSVGSTVRLRDMRREQDVRVPHRRLGRGEPCREQALERVAGRQGDHRPQEGRGRRGGRAARRAQVQDPRDQGRLTSSHGSSVGAVEIVRLAREQVAPRRRRARARVSGRPGAGAGCSRAPSGASGAPAVALPARLRADRGRALDDRGGRCSAARAGCRRDGRAMHVGAAAARARRDAAPAARGDVALPRLRARRRATCAAAVPGPHWYLAGIGVEPAEQRRGHRRRADARRGSRPPTAPASRARC